MRTKQRFRGVLDELCPSSPGDLRIVVEKQLLAIVVLSRSKMKTRLGLFVLDLDKADHPRPRRTRHVWILCEFLHSILTGKDRVGLDLVVGTHIRPMING